MSLIANGEMEPGGTSVSSSNLLQLPPEWQGSARIWVGRAIQGGGQSQALSEISPGSVWQHHMKVWVGREMPQAAEAKQMG